MSVRIYIPATSSDLTAEPIAARVAHTVTPELENVIGAEEPEYLEAIAMNAAADDSLRLLSQDGSAASRRIVIAADIANAEAAPGVDQLPTARVLAGPVEWDQVDSIHVDDAEAEEQIQLARSGDEDAFERAADEDLMWYDVAERDLLAAELSAD